MNHHMKKKIHHFEEKESSFSSSSSDSQNSTDNNNEEISPKIHRYSSLKLNHYTNNNNLLNKENNSENQKNKPVQNKNDMLNNFYKVNLNKIHFSIYDFNKDMVIDSNIEKISKIENIIKSTKSRFSVEMKNSREYPNNLLNNIIEEKKKDKSIKNISDTKNEKITEDKMIENKIIEAINKEYNEENNFNIHKYSSILVVILLICSGLYLYFEIKSYLDSKTRNKRRTICYNSCN